MTEDNKKNDIFTFPNPAEKMEMTGERYVSSLTGQIQNEHYHRYLFSLQFGNGKRVLDVACGEGYGCHLLSQVASEVVGVDLDVGTVDYARRTYGTASVRFVAADATKLPFEDASFDVVTSFETIEHFEGHEAFLAEVARVLRPDGILIISSPNRTVYTEQNNHHNPFHLRELDREEFLSALGGHFSDVAILEQRAIDGSVLMLDGASAGMDGFESHDGRAFHKTQGVPSTHYFVAVAARIPLPELNSSVMFNGGYLGQMYQDLEGATARAAEGERQLLLAQSEMTRVATVEAEARARLVELERELVELQDALAAAARTSAEREQELSRLSGTIEQARLATARADEAERQLSLSQAELGRTADVVIEAQAQLAELEREVVGLQAALVPDGARSSEHGNGHPSSTLDEISNAQLKNDGSTSKSTEYLGADTSKIRQDVGAEVAILHQRLILRVRELAKLGAILDDYKRRMSAAEKAIVDRDAELGNYARRLGTMKSSASWRLTSPLRAVAGIFASSSGSIFGLRLAAFWRHPTRPKKRAEYLLARLPRNWVAVDGPPDTATRVFTNIKAIARHPFSPAKRRAHRGRQRGEHLRQKSSDLLQAMPLPAPHTPYASHSSFAARVDGDGNLFRHYVRTAHGMANGTEFVPLSREHVDAGRFSTKLIAYYLPQFHPIPENDEWWGKGFTEWRNVARAFPVFEGHYQPRIPGELGYYDLRVTEVMRRQVDLAKQYGLSAFCFHFYWFGGKRLLEMPLETFLGNEDFDLEFSLCWANENWSKRWDGGNNELMISQQHSPDDDIAFLRYLDKYFRDRRYMKVDGKPVLTIYRPSIFPDIKASVARWREEAGKMGYPGLYLIATNSFAYSDYAADGFDALSEFPPHSVQAEQLQDRLDLATVRSGGYVYSYQSLVGWEATKQRFPGVVHPGVMPTWDNSARRPYDGHIFHGATPELFGKWLTYSIECAAKHSEGQRFVFINAWNEWAEGAYLEPDAKYGYAWLQAIRDSLEGKVLAQSSSHSGGNPRHHGLSAILPCYNHARFLPERIASILNQSSPPDEIIFIDDASDDDSVAVAESLLSASRIPYRIIANKVNSGSVFRQWIVGMELASYDLVWIAETDDSADEGFLKEIRPAFEREDVMIAYGRIKCIDPDGRPRTDLDSYYDGLRCSSWGVSKLNPAWRVFSWDFAIKNIIPNVSGAVFRRPILTEKEKLRLCEYKFAGDWYFYSLVLRGGVLSYCKDARSFFRVNSHSASRSSFFTDRHLLEHQMILDDLRREYCLGDEAAEAHTRMLAVYFPQHSFDELMPNMLGAGSAANKSQPLRICIAAHSFAVGGGEVVPVELANELKGLGHHVTYLVMERQEPGDRSIRGRLRPDIPVVYWDDVKAHFKEFVDGYGIEVLNSHNVTVEYNLYRAGIEINIAYISSLHGGYETVPHILKSKFVSYLKRNVDLWLYLSQKNKEILSEKGVPEAKFERSFNAVPPMSNPLIRRAALREANGIPSDAFCMVLCSRAIEEKGWRTAIEVCIKLNSCREAPIFLVLIGDGPMVEPLRKVYGELGFIKFLGHIDNPRHYLACFDLGIFPSVYAGESFPLFLLECFEAGLPVASTDIGEIAYVMGDSKVQPGGLVSFRSAPESMVDEMAGIVEGYLTDPDIYAQAVLEARVVSKRFDIEKLSRFYVDVFKKNLKCKVPMSGVSNV
ncbi:glycoside hydrolase family 99-like domain-containing protein [Aminobacter sp. HY435]|uniref:glycoside hydrolase family 99-like domain-containing protein n=1 Tax=Aminobacter sp. HY435 TaxID=2970917 RepID=UPI0022B9A263|nr:glycoside hydrolase family 99-like domain-containing protein [Aminobacter sp. HY435]